MRLIRQNNDIKIQNYEIKCHSYDIKSQNYEIVIIATKFIYKSLL